MDFFETPTWDADPGTDKLTHELFRFLNVPKVKISKKRKRDKYANVSVINKPPNDAVPPKEGKAKIVKAKKNRINNRGIIAHVRDQKLISKEEKKCIEEPQQSEQSKVKSNDHVEKVKCSSSLSKNLRDNIPTISLSNSTTLSPTSPIKRKRKKKKQNRIELDGEIKSVKTDHTLKALKDKLDLNISVKSCDKEINEYISTPENDHEQGTKAKNSVKSQIHGRSSHSVKNLQKITSVVGGQLSHLKKSINDTLPKKNNKIKTRDPANLSKSIISESLDNQSHSHFPQQKVLSEGGNAKKLKKKKGLVVTCETMGTSSHSLEIPNSPITKKRKRSENSEISQQRVKKLRKVVDTQSNTSSLSNYTPMPSKNAAVHEEREHDHVDGRMKTLTISPDNGTTKSSKKQLTLREKMMDKLRGSRFRFLNEQIYGSKSDETGKFFQRDPESFEAYHEGYKQQLLQWPLKPVDVIIKYLKKKPANYIIADFGCGDAQIAQSLPNQVHSFDHVALNDHVTVCDMAHTPLSNGCVDVAVFCLSLMGSNLSDYVCEANRVLKIGGILKIAEVESRFDDVEKFIQVICKFGFLCIRKDLSKDVFYLFDFKKEKNLKGGKKLPVIELRDCSYKKR